MTIQYLKKASKAPEAETESARQISVERYLLLQLPFDQSNVANGSPLGRALPHRECYRTSSR